MPVLLLLGHAPPPLFPAHFLLNAGKKRRERKKELLGNCWLAARGGRIIIKDGLGLEGREEEAAI